MMVSQAEFQVPTAVWAEQGRWKKEKWKPVQFKVKLVNINGELQKEIRDVALECKTEVGVSERFLSCDSEIIKIIFAHVTIINAFPVYCVSSLLLNALYVSSYIFLRVP